MADLNKVFLMGRLTFDPELRRTPTGTAVTELRMATSRSWTGRDGERREETLFIDVTVWDRQAENCCQYLRKGSGIHVEGFLKMDTWEDKTSGEKRSKVRVSADRVQFLDSRRGDGGGSAGADDDYGSTAPPARDSGRRGGATSGRAGGGGGYGEPSRPASAGANGPARPSSPSSSPSDQHASPDSDDHEEDDIPF
jgi:single-strand DNA-binding protein